MFTQIFSRILGSAIAVDSSWVPVKKISGRNRKLVHSEEAIFILTRIDADKFFVVAFDDMS